MPGGAEFDLRSQTSETLRHHCQEKAAAVGYYYLTIVFALALVILTLAHLIESATGFYNLSLKLASSPVVAALTTLLEHSCSLQLVVFYCLNYCPRYSCCGDDGGGAVCHVESCDGLAVLAAHHDHVQMDLC